MSRVAARIELTEAERKELERRERAHRTPYRDRQRAKVILLASAGLENQQIAGKLKLSRMAVGKWRERFSVERIAGLVDAPGRGRLSNLEPRADGSSFKPGSATSGSFARPKREKLSSRTSFGFPTITQRARSTPLETHIPTGGSTMSL